MFTARINELFQHLGAKNGQVAKLAGFDRTNISHLRSSGRTPERTSPTIRKRGERAIRPRHVSRAHENRKRSIVSSGNVWMR